jgi:hypothetical protein
MPHRNSGDEPGPPPGPCASIREIIVGAFRILYTTEDPVALHILAAVRSERPL